LKRAISAIELDNLRNLRIREGRPPPRRAAPFRYARIHSRLVIRSLNLPRWTMPTSTEGGIPESRSGGGVPRRIDLWGAIREILLIRRTDAASRYWNSYDESL